MSNQITAPKTVYTYTENYVIPNLPFPGFRRIIFYDKNQAIKYYQQRLQHLIECFPQAGHVFQTDSTGDNFIGNASLLNPKTNTANITLTLAIDHPITPDQPNEDRPDPNDEPFYDTFNDDNDDNSPF